MILAQIEVVKPIAEGLGSHFLPWACALELVAIVFMFKLLWDQGKANAAEKEKREREHDAELAALQKSKDTEKDALNVQLLAQMRADAEAQRNLMLQIVPLSGQLVEMIRLTDKE